MKLVGLLVGVVALASGAWAQCGMRPVAVFGGSLSPAGVTARGDLVVSNQDVVALYDVSTPEPRRLDQIDPTNGGEGWHGIRRALVTGDVVCLDMVDQLRLLSASGGRLEARGTFTPGGTILRVQASEGVLCTASFGGGSLVFTAVDVHDPASPRRLGSVAVPQATTPGLIGRDRWMYAGLSGGTVCADLSTPEAPRVTGVPVSALSFDAVEGDRLWVRAANVTPSVVYDISTPAAPRLLGTCALRVGGLRLTRLDGVWYLASTDGFQAMDLSDLANPRLLGVGPPAARMPVVGVGGGRIAASGSAFCVADASDPSAITTVGVVSSPVGLVTAMAAEGTTLYVLQAWPTAKLLSFDVSDPSRPELLGELPFAHVYNRGEYLAVSHGLVVALVNSPADDGSTLRIFDATDPHHMVARGSLSTGRNNPPAGLGVDGRLAAINWSSGVTALVDLGDPDAPAVRATVPTGSSGVGACSLDAGLLVAGGGISNPVDVYDVSDPGSPRRLHRWESASASGVGALRGTVVYATASSLRGAGVEDLSAIDTLTWGLPPVANRQLVKGQTGIAVLPPAFISVETGVPYLRAWLASDRLQGRESSWNGAAEASGALFASQGSGPIWILPLDQPQAPVIRSGFLPRLQTDPPCIGEPYDLTVDVPDADGVTYQWFSGRNRPIPGETSATLRIPRATSRSLQVTTYCEVTNARGVRDYPTAGTSWPSFRFCVSDFTCDGFVDAADYAEFVSAFEEGSPRADVDDDGFLDFFDYSDFVRALESGC